MGSSHPATFHMAELLPALIAFALFLCALHLLVGSRRRLSQRRGEPSPRTEDPLLPAAEGMTSTSRDTWLRLAGSSPENV